MENTSHNLLIGTYNEAGKSDGIYVYEFNSKTCKSRCRAEATVLGNYNGGSLAAVPLRLDGSLGASIQSFRHEGQSIAPEQPGPHVHASVLSE